jgi:START domain
MRTRTPATPIAVLCLLLAAPATSDPSTGSDPAWSPGKKGEGRGYTYQVFSQQKEGEEFVRYQVRGTIDAKPEALQRLAQELSSDPRRAPKDQTREVILKTDNEQIIHTSIDLPMMFSDRDIVTRGVKSADPKTGIYRIDFKSTEHPKVPPRDGFIRLTKTGGFWEFVPDGPERSKVTLETFVDLGGALPAWLVSGMMSSNVIGNYEDVAKEAVK